MNLLTLLFLVTSTFTADPMDVPVPGSPAPPGEPYAGRSITIVWGSGSPLPISCCRFASGLIDGKIYVFGGQALADSADSIHFVYDIATDAWSDTVAPMPTPSSNMKGVVHDGRLYVLGGFEEDNAEFRRYDPSTDTWDSLTPPPGVQTVYKYGAAAAYGKIYYYYGRWDDELESTIVRAYDPSTDSWTELGDAPEPARTYLASGGWDGLAYAAGGWSDTTTLDLFCELDAGAGSWSTLPDSFPTDSLVFGDGDFLFDHFFVAGGGGGYGEWPAQDRVFYWHADSGWVETSSLPAPMGTPAVELYVDSLDTLIFVIGGYNGIYSNTVYKGRIQGLQGDVGEGSADLPVPGFRVLGPRPFRSGLQMEYRSKEGERIDLSICDPCGRVVRRVYGGRVERGTHRFTWDGKDSSGCLLPSGVYFCILSTDRTRTARRVLLLR
jgi:hypothetical protein